MEVILAHNVDPETWLKTVAIFGKLARARTNLTCYTNSMFINDFFQILQFSEMSDAASQLIVSSDRLQSVAPDLTTQLTTIKMARPYNPHRGGLEKGGGGDEQGHGVLPIVKVLSFTLAKRV